jgi:hypothetical protein
MTKIGWIGVAVAATITLAPSISMACSVALQSQRAAMGRDPDCYDSNTAAIYGDRAFAGNPPAAWLARQKRKPDSKITKPNATKEKE